MFRTVRMTALALALAAPSLVSAEAAADADAEAREIIVTGKVDGYTTIETTTGTKTNTAIIDVPQSITVVTEAQLKDQAIRSMADLVRLIPGVSSGQGEGHRDQINLRGNNTTADFFVDGLRDDVQYFRSFYNIDRVEVHKGPNAMIFGRGGGGGLVNRVTKGAVIGETILGGTISADTFGAAYVAADTNFQLGDSAGLRLNAFYERLNTHRDAFNGDRYAINPVIGAEIGERARVQFGYEYVRDDRVIDRGIPSAFAGTIAAPAGPLRDPRFRDTFFGISGINETDFEAHVATFRGEAELGGGFTATAQALYGDYDKVYTNVFAATAVTATNTVGIEAYADPTKRQNLILQGNLEWRGDTGGIEHVILLGGEYTDQDTTNQRINGFFSTPITTAGSRRTFVPLADPVVIPVPNFVAGPGGNSNRSVASTLSQHSLYIQDQIALSPHFDVIAGVRYDRLKNGVRNVFTGALVERTDDLWSPRVGLVAKPSENSSVYLSYSKSYLPQSGDQFLTFDATNANLEPEQFDNYEIGAKWDIEPGLSLTAAVYRLDRTNTRAAGPVPGTVVLTGEQRTSGFELGLTGRITPKWQTAIGLAHTKARILQATSAAPAGRRVAQVPQTQLSIWNRYEVTDRLGVGVGLYRQSRQFTTIGNTTVLPAYTRIDAAVFFKLTEQIEAQVNVENLTDKRYFPVAHNDNNISTGAPLNARFTLGVKF